MPIQGVLTKVLRLLFLRQPNRPERFYDSKDFQISESFYIRDMLTGELIAFKHCKDSECNQDAKDIVAQFTSLILGALSSIYSPWRISETSHAILQERF
jgi:hypothetical protein